MGERLDGKVAALAIKEELKAAFNNKSRKACLAIIRFNDPASESYLKGRLKIADELGVNVKTFTFEDTNTTNDVINLIKELNNDETVDGIMVDRPLPKSFNESLVLSSINVSKDVDGYTPLNLGNLVSNQDCFSSCTPGAALRILDFYKRVSIRLLWGLMFSIFLHQYFHVNSDR